MTIPKDVRTIIKDIKSLKIQGARNIAKMSMKALAIAAQLSKSQTPSSFYTEMLVVAHALSESRPTEPMMRNMIDDVCRFTLLQMRSKKSRNVDDIRNILIKREDRLLARMDEDAKLLARHGAELIPDDALVLTHCHSSTSTMVIKQAKRMKKKFGVVCFETRPRFQGRVTATELAEAGIDVTLSVDGGMELFMKKADIVIVGADSITSRGDLINKIGTSTLAHIAHTNDVSFYCAAELFKYSPATLFGTREKIEERDPREVWDKPPKGVKIRNPAFEATPARYVSGYITEAGVIPSSSLFTVACKKLGIEISHDAE